MIWAFLLAQATEPPPATTAAPVGKELHDVVVSAIRNCGGKGDEIVVCSKDRGYAEKYRLEKLERPTVPPGSVQIQTTNGVGQSGIGSCTNIGAGGSTGCSKKEYDSWAAWKAEQKAKGQDFPW